MPFPCCCVAAALKQAHVSASKVFYPWVEQHRFAKAQRMTEIEHHVHNSAEGITACLDKLDRQVTISPLTRVLSFC